jgi:predicted metal-dependent phosphoesterase TrpH
MVTVPAKTLIRKSAEAGFHVLAITHHNHLYFSQGLSDFARDLGVLLIPAVEATIERRHVLLYNFPDYRPSWRTASQVRDAKGPGQLVIAPHPFYPVGSALRRKFFEWIDLFDAVELSSLFMTGLDFNRRARKEAARAGLPVVANNDLHFLSQLGVNYSEIFAEPTVESVIKAVKQGRVRAVTGRSGFWFVTRWFLQMFSNQTRYALASRRNACLPGTE